MTRRTNPRSSPAGILDSRPARPRLDPLQGSLFGSVRGSDGSDPWTTLPGLEGLQRRALDDSAWVDHQAGWLPASDELFVRLVNALPWRASKQVMYDAIVENPRLSAFFPVSETPAELGVVQQMAELLGQRYGRPFTHVGCNLYRDGRDSVAWHGDRVARALPHAMVAILSVGAARPFKLRPRGGGPSIGYKLGRGDLLVMGGSCQRTWQHTVPKIARAAGPRISVTYRYDYGDEA